MNFHVSQKYNKAKLPVVTNSTFDDKNEKRFDKSKNTVNAVYLIIVI